MVNIKERFFQKVNKTSTCWIWTATKNGDGYGHFSHKKFIYKAHRFSWMLLYGDIPKGVLVLHKCDNPPCVNPEHLFLGTDKDNVHDAIRKGRRADLKGEQRYNCKIKDSMVPSIRDMYLQGHSLKAVAKVFGVDATTIHKIVIGKSRQHVK
jgi:hypothetical protein